MKLRLTNSLVKEFVTVNSGEDAYKIAKVLTKGLTDEQIARRTKLKVNSIRAALNRLHYSGIITYSKEKAKDSNWYTYTWFLEKARISELLAERYREEWDKLNEKLSMQDSYIFFKCKKGCEHLPFELAYEYNFRCPECGMRMEQKNNDKDKREIRTRIREIKKLLN